MEHVPTIIITVVMLIDYFGNGKLSFINLMDIKSNFHRPFKMYKLGIKFNVMITIGIVYEEIETENENVSKIFTEQTRYETVSLCQ